MSSIFCNFENNLSQSKKEEILEQIDAMLSVYDVRPNKHPRNRCDQNDYDLWVYVNCPRAYTKEDVLRVADDLRKLSGIQAQSVRIVF